MFPWSLESWESDTASSLAIVNHLEVFHSASLDCLAWIKHAENSFSKLHLDFGGQLKAHLPDM